MHHSMKLPPQTFDKILRKEKQIEARLLDEKRRAVRVGDTIEFTKLPARIETMQTLVIALYPRATFADLAAEFTPAELGHKDGASFLAAVDALYTRDERQKYTVLGMRLEVI